MFKNEETMPKNYKIKVNLIVNNKNIENVQPTNISWLLPMIIITVGY